MYEFNDALPNNLIIVKILGIFQYKKLKIGFRSLNFELKKLQFRQICLKFHQFQKLSGRVVK